MRKFYRPAYDCSGRYRGFVVCGRELGDFDVTTFWLGQRFDGVLPQGVRLYVDDDPPTDYVANPISWPICSPRLASLIERRAASDVQFIDAPLYRNNTNRPVEGYKIVNVVRRIPCLDLKKAVVRFSEDDPGEITSVPVLVLDPEMVPPDAHVFRLAECFPTLIFSDALFNDLYEAKVRGIAFVKCQTS